MPSAVEQHHQGHAFLSRQQSQPRPLGHASRSDRTALHRGILGTHQHRTRVDQTVPSHERIAGSVDTSARKGSDFAKSAGVQECEHPLNRSERALRMVTLDSLGAARCVSRQTARLETREHCIPTVLAGLALIAHNCPQNTPALSRNLLADRTAPPATVTG